MENEAIIRMSVFLGLFILLSTLEYLRPRRKPDFHRSKRWITNWGIVIIDTLSLRLMAVILPFLAVGAAVDAARMGIGVFNVLNFPFAAEFLISILVLDFVIWAQHVVTHKIPFLWRLHRVHHADREMDVTTAIRFHPVEILLSMLLKIGAVYILGPAAVAVVVFEILLNGLAMFNHANIAIPSWLDRIFRTIIVTPDMHRVHHSTNRDEHDSNYGFALSIWDKIFGTYIENPRSGHDQMAIGLHWQDGRTDKFWWSLWLPFRRK